MNAANGSLRGFAVGLAVIMVLAAAVHLRRREYRSIGLELALFIVATSVAWHRFDQL